MTGIRRIVITLGIALVFIASAIAQGADPLPSWSDGAAKQAIVAFVGEAATQNGPRYISPSARIAVFDNDGTLWAEKPLYFQLAFAIDRVKTLASEHPEWEQEEPFASLLKGDTKAVLAGGEAAILQIVMASHAGMTTDAFEGIVGDWLSSARHPKTGRLYNEMTYQPMVELLAYLRANAFKTYIVSGGGNAFMRPWVEKAYGIPPEQVIGSSIKTRFEVRDGRPVIVRLPEIAFINDKEGKPVNIDQVIGRRPVFAFGNSDGDLQMLQWTAAGEGARFMGLVHHTDGEREWAYDRASHVGRLDKALDEARKKGWTLVDMKNDWKRIFSSGQL